MANVDYPNGLTAVMSGSNCGTPRLTKYKASVTSAIYAGGIVCLRAGGQVANLKTTTGAANVVGVASNYVAAATTPAADVWVYDDPNTIFMVQTDGTTDPGSTTAQAKIGAAAALEGVTGSTASGRSNSEINYSTISTSTTDPLRIVGLYNQAGNDMTLAHARYLVVLNRHIWLKQAVI
jgi:hypothetical protein